MALATVGTTNLLETFSPASNGNVQSFMTASRAEFAWIDASPGKPLLSAMSMSRLSASRTSPTTILLGLILRASLTSRRNEISPVPSRFA